MSIVENMQEIHCCVFVDVFCLLRVDEVPGTPDIGIGNVDGRVKFS